HDRGCPRRDRGHTLGSPSGDERASPGPGTHVASAEGLMGGGGAVRGGSLVRRERALRWSRRVLLAGLAAVLVAGPIAGADRVAEQLTAVAGEALDGTGHE